MKKILTRWDENSYISFQKNSGDFILSESGKSSPIYISSQDFPGVIRAAKDLQTDIGKVTSAKPEFNTDNIPTSENVIIIGSLEKSPLIQKLIENKKLNVDGLKGKWETFITQVYRESIAIN